MLSPGIAAEEIIFNLFSYDAVSGPKIRTYHDERMRHVLAKPRCRQGKLVTSSTLQEIRPQEQNFLQEDYK